MWTCPKCKREFKNRNQDHTCGIFTIESVFEKQSNVFLLFKKINTIISSFGDVKVTAVKNAIMFSVQTSFVVLKPHKNYLGVEFTSTHSYNEFPIERCVKISKTRYAHILKIDSMENIDAQLINWLKEAYKCDLPLEKKHEL
jgi:hypothetical protein